MDLVKASLDKDGAAISRLLETCASRYLALQVGAGEVDLYPSALDRWLEALRRSGAPFAYAAHHLCGDGEESLQPLVDYQTGSVRDDFDFGPLVLIDLEAARRALNRYPQLRSDGVAGWYGLRLALTLQGSPMRVAEPLYRVTPARRVFSEEEHFRYADPRNLAYQKEMEAVFTRYAQAAGFYLPPRTETVVFASGFACEASVVIPVKNRAGTVIQAVRSALEQDAPFAFNVIVVDNHSTDGTSAVLAELARCESRLVHHIPAARDLEIGGCWNEALRHPRCGRFAVQLDSDDLYASSAALKAVVDKFYETRAAAVVGSYRLVDLEGRAIPPGVIDHREWSDENGHNNALRINGFGAPRAFYTPAAREIGFLNVSYGEDYAMMLALTRRFRLARIFEPIYLCRRWEGNSDAAPSIEKLNRFNFFKDGIRSAEIRARQGMNRGV